MIRLIDVEMYSIYTLANRTIYGKDTIVQNLKTLKTFKFLNIRIPMKASLTGLSLFGADAPVRSLNQRRVLGGTTIELESL
jgi:hypothetical protein